MSDATDAAPPASSTLEPRKRGRRTTSNKQHGSIIDFVAMLLKRRARKSHIKRRVNEEFFKDNPVGARTIENYIARARILLIEISGKSKQDHRIDAILVYDSVITDPAATTAERLKAQEGLRQLLNLDEPPTQKHELTGAGGGPIVSAVAESPEQVAGKIEAMLRDGAKRAGLLGDGTRE